MKVEFETYQYGTNIKVGKKEIFRLWTLRKNTQDEFIVNEVYEDNCYKLPDDLSGKVIVDIGANIGAFAAACVDRGAKLIFCFDPKIEPATKLFPAQVVLSARSIVGDSGPDFVNLSNIESLDGIFLTGGSNTFVEPTSDSFFSAVKVQTVFEKIGEQETEIWLKLDCEGSEYEILSSDLPWDRIERVFGECHTLIDGKLSRDTAPIENGRFPIAPSISSIISRLESVGYVVQTQHNSDDEHLDLFWAVNSRTVYNAVDQLYSTYAEELAALPYDTHGSPGSISKAVEYAEKLEALGIFTNSPSMLTDMESVEKFEKIVDRSPANEHDAERLDLREYDKNDPHKGYKERLKAEYDRQKREMTSPLCSQCSKPFTYPPCGPTHAMIAKEKGVKTVCVLTPFRNARRYLPLYFRQLTSLRDLLSQNNYSLRLVAAEGDSLDGTHDRIIELANEHNIPLTMVDTTHGHMKWGSVEDPVRMRVMSEVMNKALDEVKESDDIVVWIMSDLEWSVNGVFQLIESAESEDLNCQIFAPVVLSLPDQSVFYDTWAYRGSDGERFRCVYPWHRDLIGEGLCEISSAGTCLVMKRQVARDCRASSLEAVSFCANASNKGYSIAIDLGVSVVHAPKLSYSVLWISDAVCISGFSRVSHSLFPLLSEAGFDLEIIAQNFHGTPHNYPYLIWPANVNGEDPSGTLRMQNLLWANRNNKDKYDAIVVLDDPWNVPRITRGLANVYELIWKEEGNKDFTPPPIISWVTVDGKNVRGIDLVGTHVISVTEFGKIELGLSEQVTEITYDYAEWADQIAVVPFGVDGSIFKPIDKLECRKLTCGDGTTVPYDSFIVGTVSNNQLRKNLHLVIESFSEWVHRYGRSDAYLYLCVGKESETGCDVESLARYYDLRNKVIVNRSALPDEILAKVYNSFDVFISLSNEGFGLCALEAMSCGVPCVLADWSGYSSWVPNDCAINIPCSHTQLTAPLNSLAYVIGGVADKGAVVAALQKLYTFPEMREKLSVRGKEAARGFSWKNTADKLVNVLERVIEREAIKGENKHICSPENGCGIESSKPPVSEFPCTCGNFPLCDPSCEFKLAEEGMPANG